MLPTLKADFFNIFDSPWQWKKEGGIKLIYRGSFTGVIRFARLANLCVL